eukprot:gene15982-76_t
MEMTISRTERQVSIGSTGFQGAAASVSGAHGNGNGSGSPPVRAPQLRLRANEKKMTGRLAPIHSQVEWVEKRNSLSETTGAGMIADEIYNLNSTMNRSQSSDAAMLGVLSRNQEGLSTRLLKFNKSGDSMDENGSTGGTHSRPISAPDGPYVSPPAGQVHSTFGKKANMSQVMGRSMGSTVGSNNGWVAEEPE